MKLPQLRKKYPKAFNKYHPSCYVAQIDVRELWKEITDFMDKRGIIITVTFFEEINVFQGVLDYGDYVDRTDNFKSRKEAETKAICKAFEILESRC